MIVESTTDSVVVVDRDWRISFFNQRAWANRRRARPSWAWTCRKAF
jgi:hypothetical protein